MIDTSQRALLNATWLIKLRWAAVVGQLLTIIVVELLLRIPLFVQPLIVIVGATTISNLLVQRWVALQVVRPQRSFDRSFDFCLGLVSMMDLLSLTALLYATGGAANPFALFFFVNVALSAMLLPRSWAWGLNLLAVACFAFILYDYHPIEILDLGRNMLAVRWSGVWSLTQLGLLVGFAGSASVIVYFLTRLTSSLRRHEHELREAQRRKAESDKLDALGTLAAGAAHELATPLSTIAVVAREVEKTVAARLGDDELHRELVDDVHLIRSELDRCRRILDRMSADAGQAIGEAVHRVAWERIRDETLAGLANAERIQWELRDADRRSTIDVPPASFCQALRGLIQNGLDASAATQFVRVTLERSTPTAWSIRIADQGRGMEPDTVQRVGQPFFTTKAPGQGMGLGVFLAGSLIRRIGGQIHIASTPGTGTTLTLTLPASPAGGEVAERRLDGLASTESSQPIREPGPP
jgi:two-component system sensor histidine kinase RegB